uniref:Secreted protein n=1 Tax=Globodera rostochiensis TaxID=31243 RepID=A0A914ID66_GLORO
MQMFILICPIFFAFLPLPSKGENLSLCFSQFKSLFFNSKISTVLHTEERAHTVFCQLPPSEAVTTRQSLNLSDIFGDIMPNCAQICGGCYDYATSKSVTTVHSDGRTLRVGCLSPEETSLTVFSVSLPYPTVVVLSLYRKPLKALPPKIPKFRRFPSIDLRLPADFFYPFGCE